MNAPAGYLSQLDLGGSVVPGHDEGDLACTTVATEGFPGLEPHLVSIATYLSGLSIDRLYNETRRKMRRTSKRFAVWNGSLLHRFCGSLRLNLQKHVRRLTMKSYHDDNGQCDKKATLTLNSDRFWCPLMYEEVCHCVKTWERCQRISFVPKYSSRWEAFLTQLFDTFSVNFTEPLLANARGMRYLLIFVETLRDWP